MENITIKDIVEATGGVLLCGDANKEIRGFSIDSREGSEDSIFVPIIGERVDAHRFIEGALALNGATFTSEHCPTDAGADEACGSGETDHADGICPDRPGMAAKEQKPWETIAKKSGVVKPWIYVKDTVRAMQQVGTLYRNRLSLPVVAVTGSVGKTTTREMIAAALSAGKRVFQTQGNQNSQIGVPLTLSHMSPEDEAAVLEIGMSERGQIETLTKMIRPDIAVVTMIGVSHIAQLKSQENICLEKMDIVKGVPEDGLVFLNGDDPFLVPYRGKLRQKTFFYGMSPDCDYRAEDIVNGDGQISFMFCANDLRLPVTLSTMGEHNVRNALVALGVAQQMGVDVPAAARKLSEFHGQRLQFVRGGRCTVIDDTYNASPDSMKASVGVLSSMANVQGRRVAALSDMLELGEDEKRYHYEVGEYIAKKEIDELVVFGELSREILKGAEAACAERKRPCVRKTADGRPGATDEEITEAAAGEMPEAAAGEMPGAAAGEMPGADGGPVTAAGRQKGLMLTEVKDREAMTAYLTRTLRPEDVVLLKASNGMKLSQVAAALTE